MFFDNIKHFASILGGLLLVMWAVMAMCIVIHENTHQQIFKYYGVDSKIHYGFGITSGETVPASYEGLSPEREKMMNFEEDLVDIVGYPLFALTLGVTVMIYGLMVIGAQNER